MSDDIAAEIRHEAGDIRREALFAAIQALQPVLSGTIDRPFTAEETRRYTTVICQTADLFGDYLKGRHVRT